jgi:DNA mismatch repair protein MutS2
LKLHEAIALKASFEGVSHETDKIEDSKAEVDLQIDDYVEDQETMIRGKITAIQKQKVTMITEDGLTVNVHASRLDVIPEPIKKPMKKAQQRQLIKKAPSSINIIGLRYDEARLAIEHYHDQAILSQLKTLKIIHGFGSGTLRKLVFDYFSKQEGVLKIGGPEGEQSGYGVTVVTFQ